MRDRGWLFPFSQGTVEGIPSLPSPSPCPFMLIPWQQLGSLWVRNMGPGLAYLGEAHAAQCLSLPTHKVIFTVMPRVPQRSLGAVESCEWLMFITVARSRPGHGP